MLACFKESLDADVRMPDFALGTGSMERGRGMRDRTGGLAFVDPLFPSIFALFCITLNDFGNLASGVVRVEFRDTALNKPEHDSTYHSPRKGWPGVDQSFCRTGAFNKMLL